MNSLQEDSRKYFSRRERKSLLGGIAIKANLSEEILDVSLLAKKNYFLRIALKRVSPLNSRFNRLFRTPLGNGRRLERWRENVEGDKGEKNRGVDCAERANSNPRSLHQIANRAALNRKLEIAAGARMTDAKCSAFGLYRYGRRGGEDASSPFNVMRIFVEK